MNAKWKHGIGRFSLWLVAEVVLSIYGIDHLADYSEYLFEPRVTNSNKVAIEIVDRRV